MLQGRSSAELRMKTGVLETCYCTDTAVADCGATSAAGVTVASYSSCAQQQLIG